MKVSGARHHLAGPVQIERAAVVGERMQDGQRIVAGLDDLVQIADGAGLHRAGQRPVGPHHVAAGDHEPAHQIRAGQVVVAADRHHRALQQRSPCARPAGSCRSRSARSASPGSGGRTPARTAGPRCRWSNRHLCSRVFLPSSGRDQLAVHVRQHARQLLHPADPLGAPWSEHLGQRVDAGSARRRRSTWRPRRHWPPRPHARCPPRRSGPRSPHRRSGRRR